MRWDACGWNSRGACRWSGCDWSMAGGSRNSGPCHDRRAIREIHRVLSPEGCAILTVPQKDHLAKTYDDPSIIDPDEREKAFGQPDHLRIYGNDFPATLESAGFQVSAVSEKDFPGHLVKKYILFPPRLSTRSLATNFRKVFFARKK